MSNKIIRQIGEALKRLDDEYLRGDEVEEEKLWNQTGSYDGFNYETCKACRDKFREKKDLLEHYARVHPGLCTGFLLKDDEDSD